jgi:hypothetical protein
MITLNLTETQFACTYLNLNFVRLITPEIVLYRCDVVFASEFAESWMKTPDGEWTHWNPEAHEPQHPREVHSSKHVLLV